MKVAVCGQKDIAIKCTRILREKNAEVVFVSPNSSDTGIDSWQPSFRKWAESEGLCIIDSNPEAMKKAIKKNNIELLFSIYYDKIIKKELMDMLPLGIINTHLSLLPRYRGIAPITFAILNGEDNHGVSLHYIDEGIDRGDIIAQCNFDIRDLNANEAFLLATAKCVELFSENIDFILKGDNKRIKQDNSKALYYSNSSIDWSNGHIVKNNRVFFNKDTRSIYNWIRAFIFPPLQYPIVTFHGFDYEIHKAEPIYEFNNFEKPGKIIDIKENNKNFTIAIIATHDSYIRLILKRINSGVDE